ncbi:melatonin receptor type 1A-like [Wyeomyia smithii]|uniref:melatonin receptor type 1A-like n=1 Tax=Wyeomyia smithii TaxID=174621 RepID=UPI0024680594|nr:melatonin receptor type 1A-like [Wyeomyia smithii]
MKQATLSSTLVAAASILSLVAAGEAGAGGGSGDGGCGGEEEGIGFVTGDEGGDFPLATSATNYYSGAVDATAGANGSYIVLITPLALMSKHSGTSGGGKHHEDVSPVTLSTEWPRLARLLLLASLSVIGSIGNVFMISSVMIEDHLKKAGNAFIVNIALADLLITSVVMPASTIVLLAGIDNSDTEVCKFQWFLAACSFLVSILTLAMMAIENYLRLCTSQNERSWFNKTNVTVILLLIWFVASLTSGMQFVYDISFDYCDRKSNHIVPSEAGWIGLIVLLPLLLTFLSHIRIIVDVKRNMSLPNYKPNLAYTWDLSLVRTNFYSFLIFVLFWLPFCIILAYGTTKSVPNRVFYNTAWIGLSKSCFHNVIYCLTNRHFRSAYISLFNYCCCKTTVAVSRRQRIDGNRPTADVRVHIIPGYNMYSYTSPQRSGNSHWGKRECHEL